MQKEEKENKLIYVWCDFESTGIWGLTNEGYLGNADYERFDLPQGLVVRFKFWERWFSDTYVEWNDERNKMDRKLFDAYGLSLAVDLKRFTGDKHRIFYGHLNDENCVEIILVERERSETELGKIVPMSLLCKK